MEADDLGSKRLNCGTIEPSDKICFDSDRDKFSRSLTRYNLMVNYRTNLVKVISDLI
jgi:hypothetical protein